MTCCQDYAYFRSTEKDEISSCIFLTCSA